MDGKEFSQYTARELLQEVDNAIGRVMIGGQSYRLGNRSLTRADLGMLRQLKNDLTAQLAAEGSTGALSGFYAAEFDGR
ncbi:MAG: peptidylprolyl isomerase [Clostridiaceae bacterium]|nr:peptidylprolyl isomerase [Clostridiaceae bacterium]